jgi:hypothetical protein
VEGNRLRRKNCRYKFVCEEFDALDELKRRVEAEMSSVAFNQRVLGNTDFNPQSPKGRAFMAELQVASTLEGPGSVPAALLDGGGGGPDPARADGGDYFPAGLSECISNGSFGRIGGGFPDPAWRGRVVQLVPCDFESCGWRRAVLPDGDEVHEVLVRDHDVDVLPRTEPPEVEEIFSVVEPVAMQAAAPQPASGADPPSTFCPVSVALAVTLKQLDMGVDFLRHVRKQREAAAELSSSAETLEGLLVEGVEAARDAEVHDSRKLNEYGRTHYCQSVQAAMAMAQEASQRGEDDVPKSDTLRKCAAARLLDSLIGRRNADPTAVVAANDAMVEQFHLSMPLSFPKATGYKVRVIFLRVLAKGGTEVAPSRSITWYDAVCRLGHLEGFECGDVDGKSVVAKRGKEGTATDRFLEYAQNEFDTPYDYLASLKMEKHMNMLLFSACICLSLSAHGVR